MKYAVFEIDYREEGLYSQVSIWFDTLEEAKKFPTDWLKGKQVYIFAKMGEQS